MYTVQETPPIILGQKFILTRPISTNLGLSIEELIFKKEKKIFLTIDYKSNFDFHHLEFSIQMNRV